MIMFYNLNSYSPIVQGFEDSQRIINQLLRLLFRFLDKMLKMKRYDISSNICTLCTVYYIVQSDKFYVMASGCFLL